MIATLLGLVLVLFQVVLIARVVVDWIDLAAAGRGGGALDIARRITYAVTEPVVAPIRRRLNVVRIGSIGLDLSVLIVFLAVLILRVVVVPLIPF